MTPEDRWPAALTRAIGQQVKRRRKALDMTADKLAEKVSTVMGAKYTRAQVTNLEANRRTTITVGEVIALGAVLGVPPAMLITLGDEPVVELLPDTEVDSWIAYEWFTGSGASELLEVGDLFAKQDADVVRKLNVFRRHKSSIMTLDMDLRLADGAADDDDRDVALSRVERQAQAVLAIRNEIRAYGWSPPPLPPEVEAVIDKEERRASHG